MKNKDILLVFFALAGDLMLGTFLPGTPPVFLILAVFFLSIRLSLFEILSLAIFSGFLLDLSQLSGTIFSTIFLLLEALGIRFLLKKYIDFNNQLTMVLFLSATLLLKVLFVWLIYDRSITSNFLILNLIISIVAIVISSTIIFIKNAKKPKII